MTRARAELRGGDHERLAPRYSLQRPPPGNDRPPHTTRRSTQSQAGNLAVANAIIHSFLDTYTYGQPITGSGERPDKSRVTTDSPRATDRAPRPRRSV